MHSNIHYGNISSASYNRGYIFKLAKFYKYSISDNSFKFKLDILSFHRICGNAY